MHILQQSDTFTAALSLFFFPISPLEARLQKHSALDSSCGHCSPRKQPWFVQGRRGISCGRHSWRGSLFRLNFFFDLCNPIHLMRLLFLAQSKEIGDHKGRQKRPVSCTVLQGMEITGMSGMEFTGMPIILTVQQKTSEKNSQYI